MKKRIFCLILALVMVLSLAACAGSGNDNTENTKTPRPTLRAAKLPLRFPAARLSWP